MYSLFFTNLFQGQGQAEEEAQAQLGLQNTYLVCVIRLGRKQDEYHILSLNCISKTN